MTVTEGDPYTRAGYLQDPRPDTVARRPGQARRTSHIDMVRTEETTQHGLTLEGAARDALTLPDGSIEIADAGALTAELGAGRTLDSIRARPEQRGASSLIGERVGSGFRSKARAALPGPAEAGSPLYLLVDDLPVAALIAGYADMYTAPRLPPVEPPPESQRVAHLQADICAGWWSEGTMLEALGRTGVLPLPVGPLVPRPPDTDPDAWHDLPLLAPEAMRRQRLLDVWIEDGLQVYAMFRDTYVAADGTARVLHEYELDATVDPATGLFTDCRARPRVLPWPECPGAAASAGRLVGRAPGEVREFVTADLRGLSTCTHLNDLLRSLASVVPLARLVGSPLQA